MYRARNSSRALPIIALIVVGIIGGGAYFVFDNVFNSSSSDDAVPTMFVPATWTPEGIANLPTQLAVTPTSPVANDLPTLFIPNMGVIAPVVTLFISEGRWDVDGLGPRVGHLQRTPWLDEPGNIVLAGHVEMSDGRLGVFAGLENLQLGDSIIVTENAVDHSFAVTDVKYVQPDDLSVLYSTDKSTITLITCSDFNFVSQQYEQRVIVVGERVTG
ncbi:MAG: sortase [Chloroflexota bacterium]